MTPVCSKQRFDQVNHNYKTTIPKQDIEMIFSVFKGSLHYLDDNELYQVQFVNKSFLLTSIELEKEKKFDTIYAFITFLKENLDEEFFSQQKSELSDLSHLIEKTKLLEFLNISKVKSESFKIKNKLLVILKEINEWDLEGLENSTNKYENSLFFQKMIDLTRVYKKFECEKGKSVDDEVVMNNIIQQLIEDGDTEIAIDFWMMISATIAKDQILEFPKDLFNQAIEVQ